LNSKQYGFQSNTRSLTKGDIHRKVVHTIRQKDNHVVSDQSDVMFHLTILAWSKPIHNTFNEVEHKTDEKLVCPGPLLSGQE
jgi:hypothetical protein